MCLFAYQYCTDAVKHDRYIIYIYIYIYICVCIYIYNIHTSIHPFGRNKVLKAKKHVEYVN